MTASDPIKVYDARWEHGEFPDSEISRLFESALVYGRALGAENVTISRDARTSAPAVMEIALRAAVDGGFRVFACTDPISTPQAYYLAHRTAVRHGKTMGLTITASHNPGGYIGVKFTVPNVQAIGLDSGPEGGLSKIRQLYREGARAQRGGAGRLHIVDVAAEYIDYSLAQAGVREGALNGLPVVLEALHGAAGTELYQAFDQAGINVRPSHVVPDGTFPLGAPNPTSRGKMDAAVTAAASGSPEEHAVVVGVDGDGDRLVFGDGRGILSAGFSAVAILRSGLIAGRAEPTPVLYDPKVNPVALEMWGRLPVAPLLFRNGHSQIKEYMRRVDAEFAAEESGHYYHKLSLGGLEVYAENSIVTSLRFLTSVRERPETLDEVWAGEGLIFSTGEVNFRLPDDAAVEAGMEAVVGELSREGAIAVRATPDGIDLGGTQVSRGVDLTPGRVRLETGWFSGYLRASTNEKSVLRAFFTAGDAETGRAVAEHAWELLRSRFGAVETE